MLRNIFAATLLVTVAAGCGKPSDPGNDPIAKTAKGSGGGKSQGFSFERTYKMGDKDTYTMNMEQSVGDVVMTMTVTQEVTKVYDDGGADIKQSTSDMVMKMGGKGIKPPGVQPITLRMDKYGTPQGDDKSGAGGFATALSQLKSGISVGQTVPFDFANPAQPGTHDVGKITYVSADGPSKFHVESDVTSAKGDVTHVVGDLSLDTATKKPVAMDMTMTTSGNNPNKTHMVMTLKT